MRKPQCIDDEIWVKLDIEGRINNIPYNEINSIGLTRSLLLENNLNITDCFEPLLEEISIVKDNFSYFVYYADNSKFIDFLIKYFSDVIDVDSGGSLSHYGEEYYEIHFKTWWEIKNWLEQKH